MADVKESAITSESLAELEPVTQSIFHINAEDTTGHLDDDVDIDLEGAIEIAVDAEFIVVPTPEEVADIIENEEEGEESDKDGEQTSAEAARFV